MYRRVGKALADPALAWYRLRAQIGPTSLRRRYQALARSQGFDRAYFLLSFDCDTDRDIEVVESVHRRLAQMGITPVYAVPGELLERGATVYRALAAAGAEFLNHGYRVHTVFDSVHHQYISTLFYDKLTPEEVGNDIRRGHQAVQNVTGRVPTGFRVPHFGTYGRPNQLRYLHQVLAGLSYRFSSSTMPVDGFRVGPAPRNESGLYELAVSGCHDVPLRILDSWSFRFAPGRQVNESSYLEQLGKLVRYFTDGSHVGLLNLYADPSQVHDWPEFFEGLRPLARIAAPSFEQVLGDIQK